MNTLRDDHDVTPDRPAWLPLSMYLGCIALFLFCAVATATAQQNNSGKGFEDALYNHEQKLASAEKNQDRSYFEQSLDDNLIYVAYDGLVFTKSKIVGSLNYIDVSRYSIQNMKVRRLGSNAGLVTYDLVLSGSIAGHDLPKKQYASSVWLKRNGDWVLIFHQSTPAHH